MSREAWFVVAAIAVVAAAPTVICLASALVPLVIVTGLATVVIRIVFYLTDRRW